MYEVDFYIIYMNFFGTDSSYYYYVKYNVDVSKFNNFLYIVHSNLLKQYFIDLICQVIILKTFITIKNVINLFES